METKCSTLDCVQLAVAFAEVLDSRRYACEMHVNSLRSTHTTFPLMKDISGEDTTELIQKAKKLDSDLNRIKKDLPIQTAKIINSLANFQKATLNQICKFQFELHNFCIRAENGESVNIKIYEEIKTLGITGRILLLQQLPQINQIIENCNEANLCEFLAGTQCEELIFMKKPSGDTYSIDLESFQQKRLECELIPRYNSQLCKINEHSYMVSGGFNSGFLKSSYLINTQTNISERVRDCVEKTQGASVYKNGKVYIFGGFFNRPSNSCYAYELKANSWEKIQNLPQVTAAATAAVLENSIIVSGYDSDKVYAYNELKFSSIFDVPACTYKVICEGWVLLESKLYQNINGGIRAWEENSVKWRGEALLNYATFKRKHYIYFFTDSEKLYRINTQVKDVELVKDFNR